MVGVRYCVHVHDVGQNIFMHKFTSPIFIHVLTYKCLHFEGDAHTKCMVAKEVSLSWAMIGSHTDCVLPHPRSALCHAMFSTML